MNPIIKFTEQKLFRDYLKFVHINYGAMVTNFSVFCEKTTKDWDESHNLEHHRAVLQTAILILSNQPSEIKNNKIVIRNTIAASLVHDLVDPKYVHTPEERKVVIDFLIKNEVPNVEWIIDNMSYSKFKDLDRAKVPGHPDDKMVTTVRNIVADADKIQALGRVGIKRCEEYTRKLFPKATEKEVTEKVVEHCHYKLLKLSDHCFTEYGKKLAIEETKHVAAWVKKHMVVKTE